MTQLEIRGGAVSLSGRSILRGIDLCVDKNAFVALLGPSGSGKSTLLKAIAGLIPLSAGEIFIGGRSAGQIPPHKRKAVIVFQDMRLFPHYSIAENIAFPLRMQGTKKETALNRAEELLHHVQLSGLGERKPHSLSGGQQQRVALARALAAQPEILLLDEPFSGLDERLRTDMRRLVLALHREFSMTSILVTHDKREALSMADNVCLLDEGNILQKGTPRDMYEWPLSRKAAAYFGDVAFVNGTVRDGICDCGILRFPYDAQDGRYTVVLRPEAVRITDGTRFAVRSLMYTGTAAEAEFEHIEERVCIPGLLPANTPLVPGDCVGLGVDEKKVYLIREEDDWYDDKKYI